MLQYSSKSGKSTARRTENDSAWSSPTSHKSRGRKEPCIYNQLPSARIFRNCRHEIHHALKNPEHASRFSTLIIAYSLLQHAGSIRGVQLLRSRYLDISWQCKQAGWNNKSEWSRQFVLPGSTKMFLWLETWVFNCPSEQPSWKSVGTSDELRMWECGERIQTRFKRACFMLC